MTNEPIKVLNDGFVQLIDHMGSDQAICNAARVSYGNHEVIKKGYTLYENKEKDNSLIRYLMRHRHSTPFEMTAIVFLVRCPIHVARQWMRHRTWSYNEYSTRYKEAIDSFETTEPDAWRLQATDNKQGSGEYLHTRLEDTEEDTLYDGNYLTGQETYLHKELKCRYQERINAGVAREQARKDLPLSTYTEFYAKADLRNMLHFLSLRMDPHAQLEIRLFAEAMSKIIEPLFPASYQAFSDYVLNACTFSAQEMYYIRQMAGVAEFGEWQIQSEDNGLSKREIKELYEKLGVDCA